MAPPLGELSRMRLKGSILLESGCLEMVHDILTYFPKVAVNVVVRITQNSDTQTVKILITKVILHFPLRFIVLRTI